MEVEVGKRIRKGWVIDLISIEQAVEILPSSKKSEKQRPQHSQISLFETESELSENPTFKTIHSSNPAFLPEQLKLFDWITNYYGVSLAEVIDNAIPLRSNSRSVQHVSLSEYAAIELEQKSSTLEKLLHNAPTQAKIIEELAMHGIPIPITQLSSISSSVRNAVTALLKKGLVEINSTEVAEKYQRNKASDSDNTKGEPKLSDEQGNAVKKVTESINSQVFSPFLLYGVTGSGKTEVYIRTAREALSAGGAVLLILPEISLTPQIVDQFVSRLDQPIALLHGQVGTTARWNAWEKLRKGEIRVAIGARSAIFAPIPNLKLILVDEEHEPSYKQCDGLRYHARDVAVMRAKFSSCAVILGSATPSFESLLNVKRGRYQLLEMPTRISTRPVPKIEAINLNKIRRKDMPSENLSPQLYQAIEETLRNNKQIVILYNRRGFASYLQCETCSEPIRCPHCSVPLTYHKGKNQLLCHYCNLSMIPPQHCPVCRNPETTRIEVNSAGEQLVSDKKLEKVGLLKQRGAGTEKVVGELASLFPSARIVRMDRDTVGKKDSYREILGKMRSGEADILVGTQMIAKGHDLPGVTLVGIIDADIGLHLPDFRASERVYQLITQAAGRAGRGKDPGRVFIQTRSPEHPTLVATIAARFKAFARYELQYRKELEYPPIGRLLRLIVSSTNRTEANLGADLVAEVVRKTIQKMDEDPTTKLLGPAPAPYEKLKGRYRWHILVKSNSATIVSQIAAGLNKWKTQNHGFKDFRLTVDVDPGEML